MSIIEIIMKDNYLIAAITGLIVTGALTLCFVAMASQADRRKPSPPEPTEPPQPPRAVQWAENLDKPTYLRKTKPFVETVPSELLADLPPLPVKNNKL